MCRCGCLLVGRETRLQQHKQHLCVCVGACACVCVCGCACGWVSGWGAVTWFGRRSRPGVFSDMVRGRGCVVWRVRARVCVCVCVCGWVGGWVSGWVGEWFGRGSRPGVSDVVQRQGAVIWFGCGSGAGGSGVVLLWSRGRCWNEFIYYFGTCTFLIIMVQCI